MVHVHRLDVGSCGQPVCYCGGPAAAALTGPSGALLRSISCARIWKTYGWNSCKCSSHSSMPCRHRVSVSFAHPHQHMPGPMSAHQCCKAGIQSMHVPQCNSASTKDH
jgi:hypothetical protein